MSETLRDRLILCIPWITAFAFPLLVLYVLPTRTNAPFVCIGSGGISGAIGGALTMMPPFRAIQLRYLKRRYSKMFRSRKRPD
ncbi:hypothetical protein [Asticcacaulis solisilvae]|uniref:hypothetical protein n=1 Tax=Asticcacaulis solisilvae TaxID=1217274 RepID=UPI003FD826F2